jgi:protein-tyrosine phosphatase
MAAAVAAAMIADAGLSESISVESFGTAGYHAGEGMDAGATAALRRDGWPLTPHRARRLDASDLERLDLVLCADRANLADVRRLAGPQVDPAKIRLLRSCDPDSPAGEDEVPDPWGGDGAAFDRALALIERAARGLVAELTATPH